MNESMFSILFYHLNRQYRNISNTLIGNYFEPHRDLVLVTGGASGLGREIVKKLVTKRANVVVLDIKIPEQLEKVETVNYYKCDVSDRRTDYLLSEKDQAGRWECDNLD